VKPLVALSLHRDAVRATIERFRLDNARIFGSALVGADQEADEVGDAA
jgi:uncharacterized protein